MVKDRKWCSGFYHEPLCLSIYSMETTILEGLRRVCLGESVLSLNVYWVYDGDGRGESARCLFNRLTALAHYIIIRVQDSYNSVFALAVLP